jgi:hypothetical protein
MYGQTSRLDIDDETFSRLLAAGVESEFVRQANPRHYWAHRGEDDPKRIITGKRCPSVARNTSRP